MEDECAEDKEHTEDELQINSNGTNTVNTGSTNMESDFINYKSLIEI